MLAGGILVAVAVCCGAVASADEVSYCNFVSFTSDLQDPQDLYLPKFDNQGGSLILDDVVVNVYHSGSAQPKADNDDPFKSAVVRARVIRQFSAIGPGVFSSGGNTVTSPFINLDPDNGDLALFDATPPDGWDFGVLGYASLLAGQYFPSEAFYDSNGPANVAFNVSPLLMVNDLQFEGITPDAWQLEVEYPILEVQVCVTYTYSPEPASLGLLAVGGLALLRRRR